MSTTCKHCDRVIVLDGDVWVDPEATGDDSVWRETCDAHDTFIADHEPAGLCDYCGKPGVVILHSSETDGAVCFDHLTEARVEVIAFEHNMAMANAETMRPVHTCDREDESARNCQACAHEYQVQRRIDEAGRYQL